MKAFAILVLLAASVAGSAAAQPNTACPLRAGVQAVAFPRGAPPGLVTAVNRDLSPYAMPGGRFEAGDAIGPGPRLPSRRLVFVRRLGQRYVVAYEQGGIAHFWRANGYQVSADGRSATRTGQTNASGRDLCGPVEQLLRGRGAAAGGGSGGKRLAGG
jgi:hypothetical protein